MSAKHWSKLVRECGGVDFSVTPEVEGRLRAAGADDDLITAIREGKAKPLSETDLIRKLAGGATDKQLAAQVGAHGVDFSLTPEIEERLRAAGAGDELVGAIRQAKPKQEALAPATEEPAPRPAAKPRALAAPGSTQVNPRDGLTYVWIPPGNFQMGCSPGDSECIPWETPAHTVTITRGFWIGQTEVTQAAYQRVMGTNPSHFHGDGLPVESVTWDEAQSYCRTVGMRLPTEAEWEYAARAGSKASRYGDLDAVAWYRGNSGAQTHEVGQKEANAWGLYDMLGNAWEWVADWYDGSYYSQSASQDPQGPSSGTQRVLRGGSWNSNPSICRVSGRFSYPPGGRGSGDGGFRCGGEVP
jgi:formylglycine-generating enzyme required for sulfatase activity